MYLFHVNCGNVNLTKANHINIPKSKPASEFLNQLPLNNTGLNFLFSINCI